MRRAQVRQRFFMLSAVSVLAIFAHPDDAEFLCAGTLAHLAGRGARISIASMTAGDCGSSKLAPGRIAAIRKREAAAAARVIGARYECLNEKDLEIFYGRKALRKLMGIVRRHTPDLVFTHSPADYMVDHETTSRLCQTACFGSTAANFRTGRAGAAKPLERIPHLYYTEPFGQKDIFGRPMPPAIFVDASATLKTKEKMLACHKSQQQWLRAQQGISGMESIAREMARKAGRGGGFRWAEGFRQHLGQGFPQDNFLKQFLGKLVRD
jgi:N-acetylglucosamine malate deacetylase 1